MDCWAKKDVHEMEHDEGQMATGEPEEEEVGALDWVCQIDEIHGKGKSQGRPGSEVEFLLDTGAGISVCPPSFASFEGIRGKSSTRVRSATGHVVESKGVRRVAFQGKGG